MRGRSRNIPPALQVALVVLAIAMVPFMKCLAAREENEWNAKYAAQREAEEAEDAPLVAKLRPRLAKLVDVKAGPDEACGSEVQRVAVVQQAWLAYFLAGKSYEQRPPEPRMAHTRSFEQLTAAMSPSGEERLVRNRRYTELQREPHVAVVIASKVVPIIESAGERGATQFSAGRLEGQIVIVDVATNAVACRMPIVVETEAFGHDPSKDSVLGDWTVIEKPWSAPFWKAADAALAKASIHGASFTRE